MQILKSDPKGKQRSIMGPYVAKLFSPGRCGFLAILVSDTKISKLIFCFSILCSYRLVAGLRKI